MILHVMHYDKFIEPFIDFVNDNFDLSNHKFIIINNPMQEVLEKFKNVEFLNSDDELNNKVLEYIKKSEKTILHGLFRKRINELLYNNSELLKKTYWVMWGGDFYFPEKQDEIQKYIIRNVAYLVTGTDGEVEYVRKNYDARGKHLKAFVYPSNLFKEITLKERNDTSSLNILIGNSSTITNQHIEVFNKLEKFKNKDMNIFVPLSYGDFQYGMQVMKHGYEMFGNKFKPIIDFMAEDKYYEFLSTIDIAFFNHNRQQGMGNIITLLGFGKTVFMNSSTSTFGMFKQEGLKVFDMKNFSLDLLKIEEKEKNIEIIKKTFSKENFTEELKRVFDY